MTERRSFSEKRILLVDDEADITSSFQIGLEQYGFKVTAYNDPILALSAFKVAFFDLLLVDIRMPGMTGLELLSSFLLKSTTVTLLQFNQSSSPQSKSLRMGLSF